MHYHAERGNDQAAAAVEDRSSRSAWEAARDAPRSALEGDAERHGMHYHAERGNDKGAAAVEDRSSRSAWECRQGRSAFRFWKVTQSVTGCITTQSVGTIRLRRRWKIVPHAPRGNAARDAPRSALEGDAERHGMHYHAERGNDQAAAAVEDRSSRSAWECRQETLRVPLLEGDAERHGMHYHAERGNDKGAAAVEDRSSRSAWERRQGRSAFRFWKVTQSVTGCIPRRAWERSGCGGGGRSFLTLRVGMPPGTLRVPASGR